MESIAGKQAFAHVEATIYLDKISPDAAHEHFFFVGYIVTHKIKNLSVDAWNEAARLLVFARLSIVNVCAKASPIELKNFSSNFRPIQGGLNQHRILRKREVGTPLSRKNGEHTLGHRLAVQVDFFRSQRVAVAWSLGSVSSP